MPTTYQKLRFDLSSEVVHLEFANGAQGNRIDERMHYELAHALREIQRCELSRVLVLSGEGKHFSVGGDFDFILRGHESDAGREQIALEAREIYYALSTMEIPVIAAVQGAAVGLGATIATMADIIVTSPDAKFADPHICIGLVAGDGGVVSWTQRVGLTQAKRYLLTGEYIDGKRAYEIGLATDLVDTAAEVLPKAFDLAKRICVHPFAGIAGTKKAFNMISQQQWNEVFELALADEIETMKSADIPRLLSKMRR